MKFKFIGKRTLIVNTLTPFNVYNILQFEHCGKYLCAYIVDDNNDVLCIPYKNNTFNSNWRYMND